MNTIEDQKRAKRLVLDAGELGDGWLMADGCDDMTEQLRALFWNDSFTDLMAARIPMFLNRVLTGPDGKRMSVDDAEAAGLLLTDGAAVPPLRRLRGVRLDVLKELAVYCNADDLVRLIDRNCQPGPIDAALEVQDDEGQPIEEHAGLPWLKKGAVVAELESEWRSVGQDLQNAAKIILPGGVSLSAYAKNPDGRGWSLPKLREAGRSLGKLNKPVHRSLDGAMSAMVRR